MIALTVASWKKSQRVGVDEKSEQVVATMEAEVMHSCIADHPGFSVRLSGCLGAANHLPGMQGDNMATCNKMEIGTDVCAALFMLSYSTEATNIHLLMIADKWD